MNNIEEDDTYLSDDEEGGTRVGDIYIPPPVPPYCSMMSTGPRLIIKNIQVNNFKSFAGKIILGPFHHCFTAIIGPNGSGKSNVIDSMLFVFGYRANKIRCKKISALLHTSSKFQNVNSCSVAVHFVQILDKENDSCEELPNSDIVIERTAHRDNSSFYTINGRRVHFKEVASLLKRHNVDLDHNRFLILQGEVESIAEMKPKGQTDFECGMLEYLEDIVGTTRYKKPLIKINERVEHLTEERIEKHNRCKMAERDMKDLEQPYNEAVEYLKQENEHTRTKNLKIQKHLGETQRKLDELTKEHAAIKEELDKNEALCDSLQQERKQKDEIVQKEMKRIEDLYSKKEGFQNILNNARRGYAEAQQIMVELNEIRKKVRMNWRQMKKMEEYKQVVIQRKNEIEKLEGNFQELKNKKAALDEQLQENYRLLQEKTQSEEEERSQLEAEWRCLKDAAFRVKSEIKLSELQLKHLRKDNTAEMRKYESMKASYEESQKVYEQSKIKYEELEESLRLIKKDIEDKDLALKKLKEEKRSIAATLNSVVVEISNRNSEIEANKSEKDVLNFIMQLKRDGKVKGIIGRLGDFGSIDDKYDIAISSGCFYLDHIIVDDVDIAIECIEQLKRVNLGRGSFIAYDKVEFWKNHTAPIRTPENVERLYDLIKIEDKRFSSVFYFALRDSLIAEDLDQATRIAFGPTRYRVITLNGEIIEKSGLMTGGGNVPIRGRIGKKVQIDTSPMSYERLKELQIKAEQLQSEINYKEEKEGHLGKEISELSTKKSAIESEMRELTINVRFLEKDLPKILKHVELQKSILESQTTDEKEVERVLLNIEKKKVELVQAEEAFNKINDKKNNLKPEPPLALNDTIKDIKEKIENLEKEVDEACNNLIKSRVEMSRVEFNIGKTEEDIEQLRTDIVSTQDRLKELGETREKHDNDIITSKKEIDNIAEEIARIKSESSNIYKTIRDLEKQENNLKLSRIEIENKFEAMDAKVNEVKSQIPNLHEKIKSLRLHEIPGESKPSEPLKTYTDEELDAFTLNDIQYKMSVEEELLKKKPNLSCIKEYMDKQNIYLERVKILEDVTCKRNEMRQLYDDVRKKRYNEFMKGYHIITKKLKEMYQMITQGGDAELELVDSMDPFTEGVTFSVRPPRKTWKNISNLSGGEKTLSSLALVFALHYYKPSPLYFMDEIDAALDFKNISIVAHYIRQRTKNAQFIIISLRSNMFELSDYLVGIYKVKECTDSCCIKNVIPSEQHVIELQDHLRQSESSTDENVPLPQDTETINQSITEKTKATPDIITNNSMIISGNISGTCNNLEETIGSLGSECTL